MFIAKNKDLIVLAKDTREELEKALICINYDTIEETDEDYTLYNGMYVTAEEKAEQERERLDMLFMTGSDVERAIYKVKGMDFDDILKMVAEVPTIDVKALGIEFRANNFYRGNPYISQVGALLGFTSDQMDKFFETKDYKELLPTEETDSGAVDTGDGATSSADIKDENVSGAEETAKDNSEIEYDTEKATSKDYLQVDEE